MTIRPALPLAALAVLAACGADRRDGAGAAAVSRPIIYESDDRLEVFEHPAPGLRAIAENAVVALVRWPAVREGAGGGVVPGAPPWQAVAGLKKERKRKKEKGVRKRKRGQKKKKGS